MNLIRRLELNLKSQFGEEILYSSRLLLTLRSLVLVLLLEDLLDGLSRVNS